MQEGNHEVRTAWVSLRCASHARDKQWAADRATILQALGVLDPDGKPTAGWKWLRQRMCAINPGGLAKREDKMLNTCHRCHSSILRRGNWRRAMT